MNAAHPDRSRILHQSSRFIQRVNTTQARVSEALSLLHRDGTHGVRQRLIARAYRKSGASTVGLGLEHGEVADSTTIEWTVPAVRPHRGQPLRITWITTPPGAGSGGHTTMFRVVQGLVEAGHHCTLAFYDRYFGRVDRHERVIREAWPWLDSDIEDVRGWIESGRCLHCDILGISHVLGARPSIAGRRMYFVQDFEPFFYGQGSEFALCEDTYRFGYTCIAVGRMVSEILRDRCGVSSVVASHGCDTSIYSLANTQERNGVAFYAKPDVPRPRVCARHSCT